jgi:hypothetical protein
MNSLEIDLVATRSGAAARWANLTPLKRIAGAATRIQLSKNVAASSPNGDLRSGVAG